MMPGLVTGETVVDMRLTTVTVVEEERPRWDSLGEAIMSLSAWMESIPAKYRLSATLEIGVADDGACRCDSDAYPTLTIRYKRPATAEEILGAAKNDPLPLPGEDYVRLLQSLDEHRASVSGISAPMLGIKS